MTLSYESLTQKHGKDTSREDTTDSDSHLKENQRRAQPQQTISQNANPQQPINLLTINKNLQFERQIKSREQDR